MNKIKADIIERIRKGGVITCAELNNVMRINEIDILVQELLSRGVAKRIPWRSLMIDGALVRADLQVEQDETEVKQIEQRIRQAVVRVIVSGIDTDEGLSRDRFNQLGRRMGLAWKQDWLKFQMDDDRIVQDGDVYRPGVKWAITRNSVRAA